MITKSVYKSNIIIQSNILKHLILIQKLYNLYNILNTINIKNKKGEDTVDDNKKLEEYDINQLKKELKNSGEFIEIIKFESNSIKILLDNLANKLNITKLDNIYNNYINNLVIKKYANVCNYDGYVLNNKNNKINILKRSCGKILYNSDLLCNVTYIANVLLPVEGTLFRNCEILPGIKKNFGFLAKNNDFSEEIIFIVPFIFISDKNKKEILNNNNYNRKIDIITLQSYFEIHDQFIKVIGKIPDNKIKNNDLYQDNLTFEQCRNYFQSFNINKKEYFEQDNIYNVDRVTDEDLQPTVNSNYNSSNTETNYTMSNKKEIQTIPPEYLRNTENLGQLINEIFEKPEIHYKYTNNGVTCWMNSSLQLLNQITTYKKELLNTSVDGKLLHVKNLLQDNNDYETSTELKEEITSNYENEKLNLIETIKMDAYKQEDASEAISKILEEFDRPPIKDLLYDFSNVIENDYSKNLAQLQAKIISDKEKIIEDLEKSYSILNEEKDTLTIQNETDEITKKINDLKIEIENKQKEITKIKDEFYKEIDIGSIDLMNKINEIKEANLLNPYDIVTVKKTRCNHCGLINYSFNYSTNLFISFEESETEISWIDEIKNKYTIDDYKCNNCSNMGIEQTNYYYFKDYIITRFARDANGIYNKTTKINELDNESVLLPRTRITRINNNDELDYDFDNEIRLDLRSIICKDGGFNSGHYINISKDNNNRWVAHNDNIKSKIKDENNIINISDNFNQKTTIALYRVNEEKNENLLQYDISDLLGLSMPQGVGIPVVGGSIDKIQGLISEIQEDIYNLLNELEYNTGDVLIEKQKIDFGKILAEEKYKRLKLCKIIDKEEFKTELKKNKELSDNVDIDELYDFLNEITTDNSYTQSRNITETIQTSEISDELTQYYVPQNSQNNNIYIGTQGYEFNNNLKNNYWIKCYNQNEKVSILDYYKKHFKILEMNSAIDINKISDLKKKNDGIELTLVVVVDTYEYLENYINYLADYNNEENITIVLKFDKLKYNVKLIEIIKKIKNNKLFILFEFWDEEFYKDENLLQYIYNNNKFNIVLIDIKTDNKTISFITKNIINNNIYEQIIKKELIYIKLYGSTGLYQGTYNNNFLQMLNNKLLEKSIYKKKINIIFANVETNINGVLFKDSIKKNSELSKCDNPSSIQNSLDLILMVNL